ncbi:hypothetical protein [Halomontanus rarus]|uniref:hypothetical protein n=1 Tax=Halomontanus rarus TaxID=3034020 RepID=UPI0023E894C5|nr:hypothetical protein [Halovivax sp. TS33]
MSSARLLGPKSLARTYHAHAYEDAWEIVEDYQRVLEYTGRHPNAGSQRVAKALDLPRARVRPWVDDGAIPHPVRAIQTAETRGWLPLEESAETFDPLNRLVAWVCSSGTIKPDTFSVHLLIRTDADRNRADAIVAALDLEYANEHDENARTTELRIRDDGAVLGRLCWLLGAPLDDETTDDIPSYLNDVSNDARLAFARTYLENRGEYWSFTDRWILEHRNRSDYYRRGLATFYRTLGADADVHEDAISIDNEFARELLDSR